MSIPASMELGLVPPIAGYELELIFEDSKDNGTALGRDLLNFHDFLLAITMENPKILVHHAEHKNYFAQTSMKHRQRSVQRGFTEEQKLATRIVKP